MTQSGTVISDFLNADHRRLDAIWIECRDAIAAGDTDKLRARFAQFASGLRRHIQWEDTILFPAFEEQTGMRDSGPTAVMRSEHREIEGFLERIESLAASGLSDKVNSEGAELQAGLSDVLHAHNMKEENILYPMSDQMMRGEKADAIVARMKALLYADRTPRLA